MTVYVDQFGRPIDINNKPDCIVPPETSAPVVVAPPSAVPQVPAPPAESKAPDVKTPEPVPEPPKEDERTEEKEPEPAPSPIQSADPVPTPEAPKEEPKKEEEKKEPVKEEPSASKGPSSGRAITYSPYNPKPDGSKGRVCKSEEEIKQDVSKLSNFGLLRLYSTDCNQISLILKHGQHKLFVGLDNSAHPENELKDLLRTVKKDGYGWDRIDTVSLGNEVTDFNKFPGGTEAYANKINEFRGVLRAEGYNGPVVGADSKFIIV